MSCHPLQVLGAERVHKEELRIQMDVAIGRAPPLTDGQMQLRLRKEARHLQEEFREENKQVGNRKGEDKSNEQSLRRRTHV